MDYTKFYELEREPFRNDPDERFYFESSSHRRAHLRLIRAVHQRKGLSVLIGAAGCGKTTLAHHMFGLLEPEQFAARSLSIGHAECADGWLLPTVATAFGVTKPAKRAADQLAQIQDQLAQRVEESTFPVLLVDEAQMLRTQGVMEEFRGLLNLTHEDRKVISIVLFGLTDLADVLRLDEPLAQRVEVRYELVHLSQEESAEYVRHRLTVAGATGALYTDEAIDAIWTYTRGVPRLINTLCDNTLFEGLLDEARPVDASLVSEAAEQLCLGEDAEPSADGSAPDWMESFVPPAETDFERAIALETAPVPEPVEEEPLVAADDTPEEAAEAADLELAMDETQVGVSLLDPDEEGLLGEDEDDAVMLKSDARPRLEAGDFSMGSIVRDTADPDAAEESLIESAADALEDFDVLEDTDLDNEISQVIGETSGDDLDLELGVDEDDEIELALETDADEESFEIQLKSDSQRKITDEATDDGEFDPSVLLDDDDDDDDDGEEAVPATIVVPLPEAARAAATTDESTEDDDLDSLFEDIQVAD